MNNLNIIKELAERNKISLVRLADACDITVRQLHTICRTGSTKIDTLEKIAVALGVPVSYFFDEETPAAPGRSAGRDYVERGSITHAAADTPELVAALRAQIADLQADKKHLQSIIDHLLRQ